MSGIQQFRFYCEGMTTMDRPDDVREDAKAALRCIKRFLDSNPKNASPRPISSKSVTPKLREAIRALHASGMNQHDIASQLNVNQGRVNEVIKGTR